MRTAALFFANAGGSSTIVSKRSPRPFELAQLVEDVHRARLDVVEAVARRVRADARDRVFGDVDGQDLVAPRRERQREAAVVAERVEQAAARVARGRLAVLPLIEKQPGLLAAIRDRPGTDTRPSRTSMVSGTVP